MNYIINKTAAKKFIILISILCIIFSGYTFLLRYSKTLIFISGILSLFTIRFKFKNMEKNIRNNIMIYGIWVAYLIINALCSSSFETTFSLLIKIVISYFILFVDWSDNNINTLFKISRFICIFYAFSILLEVAAPNLILKIADIIEPTRVAIIADELNRGIYSGLVGEKGFAAYLMVVGAVIELAKYIKQKNKFTKYNIIFIFIYILATILTGKRMLSIILIMELILAFNYFRVKSKFAKGLLIGIISIILMTAVFTIMPQTTNIIDRFIEASSDTTSGGRKMFWDFCITMFKDRPIIGYGLNTFNEVFYKSTNYIFNGVAWNMYAHNIYYELLGETGIIGIILFLIIILKNFIESIKLFKKNNLDNSWKAALWISIGLQALFIIYGLSGNTLYYDAQLICYIFSLSLFYSASKKVTENETENGGK